MAITWVDNGTVFSSSPDFTKRVGYEEIARDSTSATFRVTLEIKVNGTSQSFYGYPMYWELDAGTNYTLKGSEKWYGSSTYKTFTATTKQTVGTAGGGVSVTVNIVSTSGGSANSSKAYTFQASSWNTAPTWGAATLTVRENNSSGRILSSTETGTENAVKVAENISNIYITWGTPTDADNNIDHYELFTQIDDGSFTRIYSGTARSYTHNIGSGASTQGKRYDYYVVAYDTYDLKTANLDSTQFQKNILTGAAPTVSGSIGFSTTSFTVTVGGASNTDGNTTFTYSLACPSAEVTVYNPTLVNGANTITVYKTGTLPTGPYVRFDELKNLFDISNWNGSMTLELTTTNGYGSTAKKTTTVSVDLRTNPIAPTSVTLNTSGKQLVNGVNYLLPARKNPVVDFSGASDQLGGALTYDVEVQVNGGSWVVYASGISTLTATLNLTAVSVTSALPVKFRVKAITSFGYSAYSSEISDTLHYWNAPSVVVGTPSRTATQFTVGLTLALQTSISGVGWLIQKYNGKSGTDTSFKGASGVSAYTLIESGLADSDNYNILVTVQDNSGMVGNITTKTITVSPATPVFSVREKGVGINAINSSTSDKLLVEGQSRYKRTGMPLTSGESFIALETNVDANAIGNGHSYIGYNQATSGQPITLGHYFRGKGRTYIDTLQGMRVTGPLIEFFPNSAVNAGLEIGYQGATATTPFIDFHSGATLTDYDSRIIARGGNGVTGGGDLEINANKLITTGGFRSSRLYPNIEFNDTDASYPMLSAITQYQNKLEVRVGGNSTSNAVGYFSSIGYESPANRSMGSGLYGIDMNNSDIVGINGIFFNDAIDGNGEGVCFLKSGASNGSMTVTDYNKLYLTTTGDIAVNNIYQGMTLWTGSAYMHDTQSATLKIEGTGAVVSIRDCPTGVVLRWERYPEMGYATYSFIPKDTVSSFIFMSMPTKSWADGATLTKLLSLSADGTVLTGHVNNDDGTSGAGAGQRVLTKITAV
jgi:hypothetical protein